MAGFSERTTLGEVANTNHVAVVHLPAQLGAPTSKNNADRHCRIELALADVQQDDKLTVDDHVEEDE